MAILGRWSLYSIFSFGLTYLVIQHALLTREQFYPTVIYLTSSKFSIVVLCNIAMVLIVNVTKILKTFFLGDLRPNEVERVNESLRFTIPELIIALSIFHEEFNVRIASLFGMLLFSKFFHVIADERMNYLEGPSGVTVTRWQHFRYLTLLWSLLLMNAQCLTIFASYLMEQGASVLILFMFEYIVLALKIVKIGYRYIINTMNQRILQSTGTDWLNRNLYLMYGKLFIDILKLTVYVMYFLILFTYYSMPLPMVRELWRSFAEVQKELTNVVESRRLRAQIHRWLKCPTAEDLDRRGTICVVCHDDVQRNALNKAKILACDHIFHIHCLLSWWERQRTCPTCRADINAMLRRAEEEQARGGGRRTQPVVTTNPVTPVAPAVPGRPGGAPTPPATTNVSEPAVTPNVPVTTVSRHNLQYPKEKKDKTKTVSSSTTTTTTTEPTNERHAPKDTVTDQSNNENTSHTVESTSVHRHRNNKHASSSSSSSRHHHHRSNDEKYANNTNEIDTVGSVSHARKEKEKKRKHKRRSPSTSSASSSRSSSTNRTNNVPPAATTSFEEQMYSRMIAQAMGMGNGQSLPNFNPAYTVSSAIHPILLQQQLLQQQQQQQQQQLMYNAMLMNSLTVGTSPGGTSPNPLLYPLMSGNPYAPFLAANTNNNVANMLYNPLLSRTNTNSSIPSSTDASLTYSGGGGLPLSSSPPSSTTAMPLGGPLSTMMYFNTGMNQSPSLSVNTPPTMVSPWGTSLLVPPPLSPFPNISNTTNSSSSPVPPSPTVDVANSVQAERLRLQIELEHLQQLQNTILSRTNTNTSIHGTPGNGDSKGNGSTAVVAVVESTTTTNNNDTPNKDKDGNTA